MRTVAILVAMLLSSVTSTSVALGQAVDDRYTFRIPDEVAAPGAQVSPQVLYDGQVGSAGVAPEPLDGWAYGLCHDHPALTLVEVVDGAATVAVNPDFNSVNESPADGYTVGVVVDFLGMVALMPGVGRELNVPTYGVANSAAAVASLEFCNTLGSPQVQTIVVAQGVSYIPAQVSGSVILGSPEPEFVRGECNNDGSFNLPDVIFFLNYLFPQSGLPPVLPCVDACDSNDDGSLNLADVIASLTALFGMPAVPLPGAGVCTEDSGTDLFGCDVHDACP